MSPPYSKKIFNFNSIKANININLIYHFCAKMNIFVLTTTFYRVFLVM